MKLELSRQIFKNTPITNYMEILSVRAELFYADGRTERGTDGQRDVTKLNVAFRNFANAPEKQFQK